MKGAKNKAKEINELREFYNGLRLRVDILFTHKSVSYSSYYSENLDYVVSSNRIHMTSYFQSMIFHGLLKQLNVNQLKQCFNHLFKVREFINLIEI